MSRALILACMVRLDSRGPAPEGQGLSLGLGVWLLAVFLRLMSGMRCAGDACGMRLVVCSVRELVMLNSAYTCRVQGAPSHRGQPPRKRERPGLYGYSDPFFGNTLPAGTTCEGRGLAELDNDHPVPVAALHAGPTPVCGRRDDRPGIKTKQTSSRATPAAPRPSTRVPPAGYRNQQPLSYDLPPRVPLYLTHHRIITLQTTPPSGSQHLCPASAPHASNFTPSFPTTPGLLGISLASARAMGLAARYIAR